MTVRGKQVRDSLIHRAEQVPRHPLENIWLMLDLHGARYQPPVPSCIAVQPFLSSCNAQAATRETCPNATARVRDGKRSESAGRRVSKNSNFGFEAEDRGVK